MFALSKDKTITLVVGLMSPVAVAALLWAVNGISPAQLSPGVITIALLTIFCSCYLRIQLPRVNIHLTISDGLIILTMLLYGGEIALLLVAIETFLASLNIMRQGLPIKPRTILVNVYFAIFSVLGPRSR